MKYFAIITTLLGSLTAAHAQTTQTFTLPAPAAPNNTMVCLTLSSIMQINGAAIGQMHACFPLPDASIQATLAAYGSACGAALTPSGTCTPAQDMALLAQSIATNVQGFVTSYQRNQAATAAAAKVPVSTIGALVQ